MSLAPIANASAIPDFLPLFSKITQQHHMPCALNPFQLFELSLSDGTSWGQKWLY